MNIVCFAAHPQKVRYVVTLSKIKLGSQADIPGGHLITFSGEGFAELTFTREDFDKAELLQRPKNTRLGTSS